jgi:hypothetical protein
MKNENRVYLLEQYYKAIENIGNEELNQRAVKENEYEIQLEMSIKQFRKNLLFKSIDKKKITFFKNFKNMRNVYPV